MIPATTSGARLGVCLDDLLASRFLPRQWARRMLRAGELPSRLEHCARNLAPNSAWRAYGDDGRIFFAVAREHCGAIRDAEPTAIDVFFLDDNAAVYSAGVWEYDRKCGWWLDDVLGSSYDCDHGWSFDGLLTPTSSAAHPQDLPPPRDELRRLAAPLARGRAAARRAPS